MIQVYTNSDLAFDSRLPAEAGFSMLSIQVEEAINKGGSAKLLLKPDHPMKDAFPAFAVPVEIYRDGRLRWRGRPCLPPQEDFYRRRTIVCEGELCFLHDVIHRPYHYNAPGPDIFRQIIEDVYNPTVEPWKRFSVGNVTVTGNSIIFEAKTAEEVYVSVSKLLKKCGGYILFDSNEDGTRRINWYDAMPYTCSQTLLLGQNLLDCSSRGSASDFATRIIPYGASVDGKRVTIDVDGEDYVENAAAVEIHGVIEKSVIYNDITDPAALLAAAERDVAQAGLLPTTITLSALDLSQFDATLDSFAVGQMVQAVSLPHGLSGLYAVTAISEDLLGQTKGKITATKETLSISGRPYTLIGALLQDKTSVLVEAGILADQAASDALDGQTQEFIFNKLTNNGKEQGFYLADGRIYINASYMAAGVLKGIEIIGENGSIAGFRMTENTLSAQWRKDFPEFTQEDLQIVAEVYLNWSTYTAEEQSAYLERYDVNMDGRINNGDAVIISGMIQGVHPNYTEGQITIDASSPKACIVLEVTGGFRAGQKLVLGLGFVRSSSVEADTFSCSGSQGYTGEVTVGGSVLTIKGGIITAVT